MVERNENVMIIDAGSRGHALADHFRRNSPGVSDIFMVPGNAGSDFVEGAQSVEVDINNHQRVIEAARDNKIGYVVIAPEEPLVKGLVDDLATAGIGSFGPSRDAARIEGDKAWAMKFLKDSHIPHPCFELFDTPAEAHKFIDNPPDWGTNGFYAIKPSGLTGGKGVKVVSKSIDAHQAVAEIMEEKKFGEAGDKIVIQEGLTGYEVSVMAIVDKSNYLLFPTSEDHKQVFDGDEGPNTGGMGGVSPHPLITDRQLLEIDQRIIRPMVVHMALSGRPFSGVIYPALFMTKDGPKVIEVNCRLGGSEFEAISRLIDSDLYKMFRSASRGNLKGAELKTQSGSAVSVALTSEGYPGSYEKGKVIYGLDKEYDGVKVFHSGTKRNENGEIVTNGGRVVFVTGQGGDVYEARKSAYSAIGETDVHFEDMEYRSDIGVRIR